MCPIISSTGKEVMPYFDISPRPGEDSEALRGLPVNNSVVASDRIGLRKSYPDIIKPFTDLGMPEYMAKLLVDAAYSRKVVRVSFETRYHPDLLRTYHNFMLLSES